VQAVAGGMLDTKTGWTWCKTAHHLAPVASLRYTTRQKLCQGTLSRLDIILAATGQYSPSKKGDSVGKFLCYRLLHN